MPSTNRTRAKEDGFRSEAFCFRAANVNSIFCPAGQGGEAGAEKAPLWKDAAQPMESRVRDLVGRMTLEEKARQVCNVAPAITRLGLPAYDYWNESLHGIGRNGIATVFPQAIGMAASFDPALLHTVADAIATEGRAKNREYTGSAQRRQHQLLRAVLLVAEHQHISRPALGPRTGDLRRGHFSDGENGGGFHPGIAGRRSQVREGDGVRETFCRPQRAGSGAAQFRRAAVGAGFLRSLFAAV